MPTTAPPASATSAVNFAAGPKPSRSQSSSLAVAVCSAFSCASNFSFRQHRAGISAGVAARTVTGGITGSWLSGAHVDDVAARQRQRRCQRGRVGGRRRGGLRRDAAAAMMMVVMVGARGLLERSQSLLRRIDVAGLQVLADLVDRLGEGAVRIDLAAGALREAREGALRGRKIARLDGGNELRERLLRRILRRIKRIGRCG